MTSVQAAPASSIPGETTPIQTVAGWTTYMQTATMPVLTASGVSLGGEFVWESA